MFVSFGQSSGPIENFTLAMLAQKGSLFATRPTLFSYIATREELTDCANALFDVVLSNKVRININQTYPLREVGRGPHGSGVKKNDRNDAADPRMIPNGQVGRGK
jgi:NADPH2:quinone reductase